MLSLDHLLQLWQRAASERALQKKHLDHRQSTHSSAFPKWNSGKEPKPVGSKRFVV
jgi:hypothetical protein